jgi:hypothetical protein
MPCFAIKSRTRLFYMQVGLFRKSQTLSNTVLNEISTSELIDSEVGKGSSCL